MLKQYINDPGYEVPENTILIVPNSIGSTGFYEEIVFPLKGHIKRDWFNEHFYYCLPINIGNQYGFVVKSLRDFTIKWDGTFNKTKDISINFLNNDNEDKQIIASAFGNGVVTIQNHFSIKTPPGINIMTIQPPNMFIPTCVSMTGVIETDQIRRDFTFNIKMTVPEYEITIKKGDPLGAFIPIQRRFVDNFNISLVSDIFDERLHFNEIEEMYTLSEERQTVDKNKPHASGRKYFNGIHSTGKKYPDHQKRLI
jgi:hypothetical protein